MDPNLMKRRTGRFAREALRLARRIPRGREEDILARQLIRCGTSVGANYRAACRARSRAEFAAKMGIVEEEADESAFWLNLLVETGLCSRAEVEPLADEASQIVAIAVASIRTARRQRA